MAGNSFGTLFKLSTFGESHGEALGGVIDGCPAGISIDLNAIQFEMDHESLDNRQLLPSVKNRMKYVFFLVYSKEKQQVFR